MNGGALLSVRNLSVHFPGSGGPFRAVEELSFEVRRGETLGIVGESGAGKTTACLSIPRLADVPPGKYAGGEIRFEGRDVLSMSARDLRALRGGGISVIFQNPMTALNPAFTVGGQLMEAIRLHQKAGRREAASLAESWLAKAGIPGPKAMLRRYPWSLSGGTRQRVMIALALARHPKLLIADEPTSALDVTTQARILDLINRMKAGIGASCLFVTHDLAVMSEMADRVMVMYGGRVCETAGVSDIIARPLHPYTRALIESLPRRGSGYTRLPVIPGNSPSLRDKPPGCPFHPRCASPVPRCALAFPPRFEAGEGRSVYCWNYRGGGA